MAGSYFPHDSNARNESRLLSVRMKFGAEGYGIYFMILERLREEPDYTSVKDYNMVAFDLRVSAAKVKSIIEDFGLFAFAEDGERFYSEELKSRMEIKDEAARRKSDGGKKGMASRYAEIQSNGKQQVTTNLQDSYNIVTTNLQDSYNKKSKEKKSKENLKENSYGAKEKPEAAAMPAGDCEAFGKNPGENPEECEACTEPVEARNPSGKENSGGAARKEASCGAFDAGAVKSSIEARKARSVAENMRICRESPYWLQATAMLHGMTAEEVLKALEAFPTHLAARGLEEPKSIQEFKSHFNNLLTKQKEQKDGNNRGNARPTAARAGEGAGTAGGGPAAGKPDRPRPRSVI